MGLISKLFGKKEGNSVCAGPCKRTLPAAELTKFRGALYCEGCLKMEKTGQSGKYAQVMKSTGADKAMEEANQLANAERHEIGITKEDARAVDIALDIIKLSVPVPQSYMERQRLSALNKQVAGMIHPWAEDNFAYARTHNIFVTDGELYARCKAYPPFNDLCKRAGVPDEQIIEIIKRAHGKVG
jgi:hypothetical protein